jgi:hypothetical protein
LMDLGHLEGTRYNYEKAAEYYRQSYEVVKDSGVPYWQLFPLFNLSDALIDLRNAPEAIQYATACLKICHDLRLNDMVLSCLLLFAKIQLLKRNAQRALEYYALLITSPANDIELEEDKQELLLMLQEQFTDAEIEAAIQNPRKRPLNMVVAEILG